MTPPLLQTKLPGLERRLADSTPFGSWSYLSRGLSAVYVQLLTMLAERSSAAAQVLETLGDVDQRRREAVLRDALVRRTIEDGVCRMVGGVDSIEPTTLHELLLATARNATTMDLSLLDDAASCVPFGPVDHGKRFIWVDDRPRTLPGRRFAQEVLKRLPGFRIERPTKDQIETLVAAERLASHVAPDLARSALWHVFMVVVGTFHEDAPRFNALTVPGLPGVMLLSPQAVSSSVEAAETLLHESMHLKFLDIEYVHPLFVPGFRPHSSPLITPVWHRDNPAYGRWPLDRVLTSMHVYLALAVFFGNAGERAGDDLYADGDCARRVARCTTRATWLFEAAQDHLDHLTAAGRDFVTFLGGMLADCDVA